VAGQASEEPNLEPVPTPGTLPHPLRFFGELASAGNIRQTSNRSDFEPTLQPTVTFEEVRGD
jgi:hypothetical protein